MKKVAQHRTAPRTACPEILAAAFTALGFSPLEATGQESVDPLRPFKKPAKSLPEDQDQEEDSMTKDHLSSECLMAIRLYRSWRFFEKGKR